MASRSLRRLRDLLDVTFGTPSDNDVVTYDSGTDTFVLAPASGGGGGAPTDAQYYTAAAASGLSAEVVVPAFVQSLLDDTSASAARSTLGALQGTVATSMPVSPSTNDRVFRTDLGLEFYYDGTRWLTVNEYSLESGTATGITATGATAFLPMPSGASVYLTRWAASIFVATTNNGTNFWTVKIDKMSTANVATTIDSFSTGTTPDTASTWTPRTRTLGVVIDPAVNPVLQPSFTKTLSPGTIFWAQSVFYRIIGT